MVAKLRIAANSILASDRPSTIKPISTKSEIKMELLPQPDITAGDPKTILFDATVENVAIDPATSVRVAIIDRDKTKIIIQPRDVPFDYEKSLWSCFLTPLETSYFLTVPYDYLSPLAYSECLVEIQIGSPHFITRHLLATIDKGLICG